MAKKILVTGGNGYIGSHLIGYYQNGDYEIHSLDLSKISKNAVDKYSCLDITNKNGLKRIKDTYDIIFHCAGSASVPSSVENPQKDFMINAYGTLNMLEFARKSNSGTFILLSTVTVFDTNNRLPLTEQSLRKPTSPYGAAKLAAESYCQCYYRTYGLDTRIARIFNIYGPKLKRLFVYDMIQKIKFNNHKIIFKGSGKQIRDYLYISDVIQALNVIAKEGKVGEDYNVCSGEKITLLEINSILLELLNKSHLQIELDGKTGAGDIEKWFGIPEKLERIGFKKKMDLIEGLKKTVQFLTEKVET